VVDGTSDDIDREARPGPDGMDIGADEITPWAFDFGTPASPVATGYIGVSNLTAYSPALGYGWLSGTIGSRDRGTGDDLTRDFDFTPLGTFAIDLANGRYRVTITMGDRTAGHGQMGVFLEGQQVASVSTQANEFKTLTFEVAVEDGQLTLLLDDLGGTDTNVVINALTIAKALPLRFDLGTASSPVASGYTRVTPATAYTPAAGGGWMAGAVQARDRGGSDPLLRDFNFARIGLFGLFLANGAYDLTVTYGDATTAHDLMATAVQSDGVGSLSTAANQFVARTYRTCVTDNLARVYFVDAGGKDANVAVDAIEAAEPAPLRFDFGTAASPLASGYLRVTNATVYSTYTGYGWLSGAVSSRDRGAGDDLMRDFNFTHDGTFVADVLPGRYRVTVMLGDATTAHDQMGVFLEGEQVDTISTLANQATTRAYTVNVTDGQLTVELRDLGGSDANAVINALEVR
jgi:fibronectin type 3 domain-containing protein